MIPRNITVIRICFTTNNIITMFINDYAFSGLINTTTISFWLRISPSLLTNNSQTFLAIVLPLRLHHCWMIHQPTYNYPLVFQQLNSIYLTMSHRNFFPNNITNCIKFHCKIIKFTVINHNVKIIRCSKAYS